jgi:hypothetical protein
MNELYTWVSQQHQGLRTFKTFQQKLESLSRDEPEQRGLYRLLSNLVGGYIEAFDEEPLPVEVAERPSSPAGTVGESRSTSELGSPPCRHQSCCVIRSVALTLKAREAARLFDLGLGFTCQRLSLAAGKQTRSCWVFGKRGCPNELALARADEVIGRCG